MNRYVPIFRAELDKFQYAEKIAPCWLKCGNEIKLNDKFVFVRFGRGDKDYRRAHFDCAQGHSMYREYEDFYNELDKIEEQSKEASIAEATTTITKDDIKVTTQLQPKIFKFSYSMREKIDTEGKWKFHIYISFNDVELETWIGKNKYRFESALYMYEHAPLIAQAIYFTAASNGKPFKDETPNE